jgi:hypothetical protein
MMAGCAIASRIAVIAGKIYGIGWRIGAIDARTGAIGGGKLTKGTTKLTKASLAGSSSISDRVSKSVAPRRHEAHDGQTRHRGASDVRWPGEPGFAGRGVRKTRDDKTMGDLLNGLAVASLSHTAMPPQAAARPAGVISSKPSGSSSCASCLRG